MTESTTPSIEESQSTSDADQAMAFEEAASGEQMSLMAEFVLFLKENKAWWLIPILLALGLIALVALIPTAAAPFIYPLF